MAGMGRLSGVILAAAGLLICGIVAAFLLSGIAGGRVSAPGAILGFGLAMVIVLPLVGGGVFLVARGRQEATEYAQVAKQKKILNMVLAQGQVRVAEVALELGVPRDQVEDDIRDLVGKGLFSGAINWKDGILYSREASRMKQDQKCPNCGGQLQLAGKGVVKCPFCGSEVFLSQ
jgi:DNA-directed RNA polymerase subunit RPC12/RpoP